MKRTLLIILAILLSVTVVGFIGLGVYNNFIAGEQPGETKGDANDAIPVATVTEYQVSDDVEFGDYGEWAPTEGLEAKLEVAFKFDAPHNSENILNSKYKDWNCDFYVSLNRDLAANQLFLGGNYGEYGWVGFHNGDTTLEANEEIALLGSVATKPWTYADVVNNVGSFICGVGDVNNALEGATFTVALRLTNPEDATETYDVNVVTYVFGGEYNIVNYTPAN